VSQRLADRLRSLQSVDQPALQRCIGTLSDREFSIFSMTGRDLGPTAIARELGVSIKTIETHLQHIKFKLDVISAQELRRIAVAWFARETNQPAAPAGKRKAGVTRASSAH
jgi:DNA-binding CsgD family transcriptional regulator